MQVSEVSQEIANGATYKVVEITGKKNTWAFMMVSGKYNYVTVRKVSNNPFGMLGKQFDSFDQAQENYKMPELKTMILLAETMLR